MRVNPDKAVLIPIDLQKGFYDSRLGERNNPDLESHVSRIFSAWREAGLPVFHVQHLSKEKSSPLSPQSPGVHFMDEAMPLEGEPIFQKNVHSALIGTALERTLRERGLSQLFILGLCTDHCVTTTTRMANNLGFDVSIVLEGIATFERKGLDGTVYPPGLVQDIHLASLDGQFAKLCRWHSICEKLAELAKDRNRVA